MQGTDGALGWISTHINAVCADLGQKCMQIPGMHALSDSDATFNYQGLATVLYVIVVPLTQSS